MPVARRLPPSAVMGWVGGGTAPGRPPTRSHLVPPQTLQRLAAIRTLVLDEADQLLEMGFRPAIEAIMALLPRQRQTLLFRWGVVAGGCSADAVVRGTLSAQGPGLRFAAGMQN